MASRMFKIGLGVTASAVLAPIVAPPLLGIAGFGPLGPVAGSAAAGIQSGVGNVVAESFKFAISQSVAMGGVLPALGHAIVALVDGAISFVLSLLLSLLSLITG